MTSPQKIRHEKNKLYNSRLYAFTFFAVIQFSTKIATVNTYFCPTNHMCVGKSMYNLDPKNSFVVDIWVLHLVQRFISTALNTRFGWLVRLRRRSPHSLATSCANIWTIHSAQLPPHLKLWSPRLTFPDFEPWSRHSILHESYHFFYLLNSFVEICDRRAWIFC